MQMVHSCFLYFKRSCFGFFEIISLPFVEVLTGRMQLVWSDGFYEFVFFLLSGIFWPWLVGFWVGGKI